MQTENANYVPETQGYTAPVKPARSRFPVFVVVIILLALCACCVASLFGFSSMTSNEDFRAGYCEGWLEEGNSIEDEPFGWCD